RDAPHLARVEPTHVDVRTDARLRVTELEVRNVFVAAVGVAVTPGRNSRRGLAQNEIDDRDVVRREVPDDVDVLLVQTEVQSRAVDVTDLAELAAVRDVTQLPDRGVVLEGVADHEMHLGARGRVDQLFAFFDAGSQ